MYEGYGEGLKDGVREFLIGWPKARERLEEVLESDEGLFYRDRVGRTFWSEPEDDLSETLGRGDTGGI